MEPTSLLHVLRNLPFVPVLSHLSPVHALPSYYLKVPYIIILSSMPRFLFEFPPSEPSVYFYRKLCVFINRHVGHYYK